MFCVSTDQPVNSVTCMRTTCGKVNSISNHLMIALDHCCGAEFLVPKSKTFVGYEIRKANILLFSSNKSINKAIILRHPRAEIKQKETFCKMPKFQCLLHESDSEFKAGPAFTTGKNRRHGNGI